MRDYNSKIQKYKNNQTKKITDIFSCKSETDLLAEFFFLISNLYSSDEDFERSNFYLSVSNFLNEKFKANKLLTVENYFNSKRICSWILNYQ